MPDTPNKIRSGDLPDLIVPTYARLLAHELILPSASPAHFTVSQDFFFTYFMPVLSRIDVDDDWYFTKYPDVAEAVQNGVLRDARHHYTRYGFYEHRLPYNIEVDEAWYLETYPDVKTAVEMQHWTSGQAHFEAFGFREGRLPYPNFTLRKAVVGGAMTVQLPSNLPSPAPDMAIPPPPSDFRASRHADYGTALGRSLLVQPSTDNKAELSSPTVARRMAWLARAAAMIILAFGLTTAVSPPKAAFDMLVTTAAPADATITVRTPADASTTTGQPKSDVRAEEVPRDSDSTGTVSRIVARTPDEEPRGEARAEGITPTVQPISMIRPTALSEPAAPVLSAVPTPDVAQWPTAWVPYDKAITPDVGPQKTNLAPTSSTEEQHDAQDATAPPQPEPTQPAESGGATSSEFLSAAGSLRRDVVAKLLERGAAMFALRDISAARELYKRAAAAGSGQAALELGKTYDPRFLATTGAVGIPADPDVATNWYRLAIGLGNAEAASLLPQ